MAQIMEFPMNKVEDIVPKRDRLMVTNIFLYSQNACNRFLSQIYLKILELKLRVKQHPYCVQEL